MFARLTPHRSLPFTAKRRRFSGFMGQSAGIVAVQYPPQHVCIQCEAKDRFEKYPLWDKKAELFTFSPDNSLPTLDPPYVLAVVNFEDGGRIWLDMTDKDAGTLKIGMPLELTFRKLHTVESIHNYFWKCMPARIL